MMSRADVDTLRLVSSKPMNADKPETAIAVLTNEIRHLTEGFNRLASELRQSREASDKKFEAVERKLEQKADASRVAELEDWAKWVKRTVIGAVIAAVLGSVGYAGFSLSKANAAPPVKAESTR